MKSKFKRGGAKGGDSDDEDMTSSASSSSHGQKVKLRDKINKAYPIL